MKALSDQLSPVLTSFLAASHGVDVNDFEFQQTRKEFDGDITLVVFSLLRSIKANPVALGTHPTPNNFTHNAWISDDSKTLYTTDEVSGAYIGSYDVTDINNVSELDRWQSSPGQGVIPHNTHFLNDYLITSYYTDGIIVHDVTYPYNIIQTGRYDSSPFDGNGFNGSWGAYPYLPSGLVLNADIEQGLDVLNVSYTRAAYLEGTVTDASNSAPLSEVNIVELSGEFIDSTNLTGFYATGTVNAGSYDVVFSKLGYIPDTVNVSITNGVLTTVNVALVPDVPVTISGTILDASTSMGLANAEVKVSGNGETRLVQTDATGNFTVTNVFSGNYDVIAGQWGYTTECNSFLVNASSAPITLSLDPEYGDDFVFDYGWTVLGNATTGHWERGVPVGTSLSGIDYNPGEDVSTDCGEQAFVTGNGGGGAGDDDVDGGSTHLLSPQMDLSNYVDPYVEYHRWFANGGGATTANDSLIIYLSDGSTTKRIDFALSTTNPLWRPKSFRVKDFFPSPTSTMSIMVTCQDNSPGHLSEGGFDRFRVRENGGVSVEDEITLDLAIYPNPSSQGFSINNEIQLDGLSVMVIAIDGKLAYHAAMISHYVQPNVAAGTYLVQLLDANGNTIAKQTWIKE